MISKLKSESEKCEQIGCFNVMTFAYAARLSRISLGLLGDVFFVVYIYVYIISATLKPETSIYKVFFQLDDSKSLLGKACCQWLKWIG